MTMISSNLQPPPGLADEYDQSDEQLVALALKRPSHFAMLYNRYVTNVYRYLLARVGNQEDAEDLTSQTFLEAMEQLNRYRGQGAFQAWLFRIARNKSIDHYRKNRRTMALEDDQKLVDDGELPETAVELTLAIDDVLRHLNNISPDRAEVISLRLFGQLETREIAQTLDKSETAVRMLLHRGISDLQSRLNPTTQERSQ